MTADEIAAVEVRAEIAAEMQPSERATAGFVHDLAADILSLVALVREQREALEQVHLRVCSIYELAGEDEAWELLQRQRFPLQANQGEQR